MRLGGIDDSTASTVLLTSLLIADSAIGVTLVTSDVVDVLDVARCMDGLFMSVAKDSARYLRKFSGAVVNFGDAMGDPDASSCLTDRRPERIDCISEIASESDLVSDRGMDLVSGSGVSVRNAEGIAIRLTALDGAEARSAIVGSKTAAAAKRRPFKRGVVTGEGARTLSTAGGLSSVGDEELPERVSDDLTGGGQTPRTAAGETAGDATLGARGPNDRSLGDEAASSTEGSPRRRPASTASKSMPAVESGRGRT